MDKKLNTEEASMELKKALRNNKGQVGQNPNMSEAEAKLKFQGKE